MPFSPVIRAPALLTALALLGGCALGTADPAAGTGGQGLFRTDRTPADAPYTSADLVRNFSRIAFGVEPAINKGSTQSDFLRRWQSPVRWRLHARDPAELAADEDLSATATRIAAATGHDIAPAAPGTAANLDIWLLAQGDFPAALDWARLSRPGRNRASLIRDFRVSGLPCFSQFSYRVRPGVDLPRGTITYALVLVRKGMDRLYRQSCFEEELAQVIGLTNDDNRVRPSIFNDDEEFVLLTSHDEALLSLLYHPSLRPGMAPDEALPIIEALLAGKDTWP
ncbi:MAG: DUF2927 domain-containing protein [Pseudomonadota bacterium]